MSLRLRLLTLGLRLRARPYLRRITDPVSLRADMERLTALLLTVAPFTLVQPLHLGGRPALSVRSGQRWRGVLLVHFHGGAHVAGSPRTHLPLLSRLARLSGVEVIAPDFRLAPEHKFPAALNDVQAVWDDLLSRGYLAENIVLSGDSAGGGLALSLLARLCARGTPPAGLIAFSPWVDLTGAGESLRENADKDPFLTAARLPEVAQIYLAGQRADDPEASPLFAAFPACPAVLLQASETEILRDDTLRMADRLRQFGAGVTVQLWPAAPHVWQMFDGWVPEARAALRDAAKAAQAMLSVPPRSSGDS